MGAIFVYGSGSRAYSSRHVTDIRHAMTDSRNIPPAARTIAAWRTHDREVRMETVNVTVRMERQTRGDAARLFSELGVSTTQAINMFSQAGSEGAEDPLRGRRQAGRGPSSREPGRAEPAYRIGRRSALRLGQPPSHGCILLIGQKYSKCAILSAWLKSTTYTRR